MFMMHRNSVPEVPRTHRLSSNASMEERKIRMAELARRASTVNDPTQAIKSLRPPQLPESEVKTLLLDYNDFFKYTKFMVVDGDSLSMMYSVELKARKPHVRLTRAEDTSYCGSASTHMFNNKIDVELPGGLSLRLKPAKFQTSNFEFTSLAMNYQIMTWQCIHSDTYFDLVCLNESQTPLAKITTDKWLKNKFGRIEILVAACKNQAVREELLVTGLTLTYETLKSTVSAFAPEPPALGTGSAFINAGTSPFSNIP